MRKKTKKTTKGSLKRKLSQNKQKNNPLANVKPIAQRTLYSKVVLYGRSGTGKTTLAGTFPGPLLVIDVRDEGTDSIADVKNADYIDLESFDHFQEIYWHLKKNDHKYKTVVIDTVSQLQHFVIQEHLKKKNKNPDQAGQWGSMAQKDWGIVSGELRKWLTSYRDLGMHVVFIGQDRVFNVEEGEDIEGEIAPEVGPNLMPSVAKSLNADAQVVCNTFIRQEIKRKRIKGRIQETKRIQFGLRIGPNPVYVTKVRKPRSIKVPDVILDPTYEKLIAAMKGKYDAEEA